MQQGCKETTQKNRHVVFIIRNPRFEMDKCKGTLKELKSDYMFLTYFITVQKDANTGAYLLYTAYGLPYKVIHMPYTSIN